MPTYEPFDWYETPLYYDIIFDADTDKEADFLEVVHGKHASPCGGGDEMLHILEPACGSGRLLADLGLRGHHVAGVDLSQGMLGFARKRLKQCKVKARLQQAPMQAFDLPAKVAPGYDLAHILVSSFKYLQTEGDAAACLSCICDHLRVGGVFVLGVHAAEYDDREPVLERHRARRGGVDVICTIRTSPSDKAKRTEQMRSRIVARFDDGSPTRRYESNWAFRTYSPGQLRTLIKREPRLRHLATYTFDHDIKQRTGIDSDDLGLVLVLRRER